MSEIPQNKESVTSVAHRFLGLADEAMRKKDLDLALAHIRKVYETDPGNMYARAYEERVLTAMAERDAQKKAETIVSARMRSFIASQEQEHRDRRPPPSAPRIDETKTKLDGVLKEIETGTQEARERLLELILERTADPHQAVEHAKARVTELGNLYRQRLERIKNLMIEHERALVHSQKERHREDSRKLYRSMVYLMQKLGVRYEHRGALLQIIAFFAHLSEDDTRELQHNALLGIYEDLLKNLYVQEGPSKESLALLEQTRTDFGISEAEHAQLMEAAKDDLLVVEHQPTIAVVEHDASLRERIAQAIGLEFPKVIVKQFQNPGAFLSSIGDNMPDILLSATIFPESAKQGMDLLKEVKAHPAAREHVTETVLMLPATDEYFQDAVREMHLGQIIQKPFSNELLMWSLRPLIFKASGARVEKHFARK
jgi:hypothetical protein